MNAIETQPQPECNIEFKHWCDTAISYVTIVYTAQYGIHKHMFYISISICKCYAITCMQIAILINV